MTCPFAAAVWQRNCGWSGLQITSNYSFREFIDVPGSSNMPSDKRQILMSIFRAVAWSILRARNDDFQPLPLVGFNCGRQSCYLGVFLDEV